MSNNISQTTKIFMLDNLDSFTYNLFDEFRCLGFEPTIYRNTLSADFIIEQIERCTDPVLLVLSPGPGEPANAGCLMELIEKTAGKYPTLGICLGHQALVQHYGGTVERAPEIIHGKSSNVTHCQSGAFENIINPLPVARYHSLVATNVSSPLTLLAQCPLHNPIQDMEDVAQNMSNKQPSNSKNESEQLVMAIGHETHPVIGFQFHPESILTTYGTPLLAQSVDFLIKSQASTSQANTSQVTHAQAQASRD